MPLYDCMFLLKPAVSKEAIIDLVGRVGKHVYRRNGVLTDVKSFGEVQLGYGIKKLDGRYYQVRYVGSTRCIICFNEVCCFHNFIYDLPKVFMNLWLSIKWNSSDGSYCPSGVNITRISIL